MFMVSFQDAPDKYFQDVKRNKVCSMTRLDDVQFVFLNLFGDKVFVQEEQGLCPSPSISWYSRTQIIYSA